MHTGRGKRDANEILYTFRVRAVVAVIIGGGGNESFSFHASEQCVIRLKVKSTAVDVFLFA